MSRIVYVNGTYLPEAKAQISIFDRGFLFADGVYEVAAVLDGKLIDQPRHEWRLKRSLNELNIPMPLPWADIEAMQRELVLRNTLDQGLIYYQVTRGAADREFWYEADMTPSLIAFTQAKQLDPSPSAARGIKVVTCEDIRWKRRDIKSISLLGQVMAKQIAHAAGADEALMVEDGFITEGSSSSAFIVDARGTLIVRPGGKDILPGLTRMAMLEIAREAKLPIELRAFSVEELYAAQEAFITAASIFVTPIVKADRNIIGNGLPGKVGMKLRTRLIEMGRATAT